MFVQHIPPNHALLKPFIRSFMLMEIPVQRGKQLSNFSVPASNITALLIPLSGKGSFRVYSEKQKNTPLDSLYIHGQHSQNNYGEPDFSSFNSTEHIALFGAVFTPIGLQAFMRQSLGSLNQIENAFVPVSDIIPHVGGIQAELEEMYHRVRREQQPHWFDNQDLILFSKLHLLAECLERFLLHLLRSQNTARTSLVTERNIHQADFICQRLSTTHGKASIEAIAKEIDLSERHVQRIMKEYVGITGKVFGEVQRFMQASRLLVHSAQQLPAQQHLSSEQFHSIIHEAGYYDQSHAIRDFKRFSGFTPMQFLEQRHALGEKIIGA